MIANSFVIAPEAPETPVPQEDINLLLGISESGKYLSAAAAALTLAAMTLY